MEIDRSTLMHLITHLSLREWQNSKITWFIRLSESSLITIIVKTFQTLPNQSCHLNMIKAFNGKVYGLNLPELEAAKEQGSLLPDFYLIIYHCQNKQ